MRYGLLGCKEMLQHKMRRLTESVELECDGVSYTELLRRKRVEVRAPRAIAQGSFRGAAIAASRHHPQSAPRHSPLPSCTHSHVLAPPSSSERRSLRLLGLRPRWST